MNQETMFKTLMIAAMSLAILSGVGALAFIITLAVDPSWVYFGAFVLAAICTIAFGIAAAACSGEGRTNKLFSNAAEQEVLSARQRRTLRKARGEVVMQKAMTDVENERENLTHRQLQAANDEAKPPHDTQMGRVYPDVTPDQTRGIERGY